MATELGMFNLSPTPVQTLVPIQTQVQIQSHLQSYPRTQNELFVPWCFQIPTIWASP